MSILDQIVKDKRAEVDYLKSTCSANYLQAIAYGRGRRPGFAQALRASPMGLIAEVKRRSPSAGAIREPFDPTDIARDYQAAGAQAISVLIDGKYFGGGIEDMTEVRTACRLPLLYKEFVVDPWQIWQASSLAASAVLLIVAALKAGELSNYLDLCRRAGLEALVEVHDEKEFAAAVEAGATCIGVNNRDLRTFEVSLKTSERLVSKAPGGCTLISESGIKSAADVRRLKDAGFHAVLVGEHLLRQDDVRSAVRELMRGVWASS